MSQYNSQGNYGQYTPQQGQYTPQQGQYTPQQGQYTPQQGQYTPQQGYAQPPPQSSIGFSPALMHSNPQAPPIPPEVVRGFRNVDTDGSGRINASELQRALVNDDRSQFDMETITMLIKMFDTQHCGTIDIYAFHRLWEYIQEWTRCFCTFDTDRSGSINFNELSNALNAFGFQLPTTFVNALVRRYDKSGTGNISFDSFIQACVTVQALVNKFNRLNNPQQGGVFLTRDQFLIELLDLRQ